MTMQTHRQIASRLAQEIMDNKISYDQFVDHYPTDTGDELIDKLFDLIEHQPKLGGLFGVSQSTLDNYNSEIFELIRLLIN
jgi:hypothetical protein